ncbi:outer membrane protein transport protein [Desulfococcaceae bacterium HSG7]|nr:outer membrane protein transport protein [Desulfococcaceae bacterium HSG7]
MKKLVTILIIGGIVLAGANALWAGGADNKTNWSSEYVGMLNRNAATDSADIAMYNPAGVSFMEDGLYTNVSAHYIAKDYNNKINGTEFDQDEPSTVPGLFAVYKKKNLAGFFGASNVIGGGEVDFSKGNATTNLVGFSILSRANGALAAAGAPSSLYYTGISSQKLKAEQTGPGFNLGASYKFNDMVSLALALRYVTTTREMSGHITVSPGMTVPGVNNPLTANVKFEEEADGWGGVIGLNISPNDSWQIGMRYDSRVDIDFDQTVKTDDMGVLPSLGIVHNGTRTRNLPAILALGVSYNINPKFRLESDLTVYLNDDADFEDIPGTPRDESAVDTGYDLGIGMAYDINDAIMATAGYLYTDTGVDNAKDMTPELPELDAHTIGAGVTWKAMPQFNLNFSVGHVFYESASFVSQTTGAQIEYEKDITFIGLGLQYKFF